MYVLNFMPFIGKQYALEHNVWHFGRFRSFISSLFYSGKSENEAEKLLYIERHYVWIKEKSVTFFVRKTCKK